jgi:hypothetical protein
LVAVVVGEVVVDVEFFEVPEDALRLGVLGFLGFSGNREGQYCTYIQVVKGGCVACALVHS